MENYKIIEHCRASDIADSQFIPLFTMEPIPMAGSFCDSYEEAIDSPLIPFSLVVNKDTGLMQCLEDVNSDLIYKKYKYRSSEIPALVKHFAGLAGTMVKRYGHWANFKLLEIGSNDNPLLNQLPLNWDLVGVDPSDVAKNAKRNGNIELYNTYFSHEFVLKKKLFDFDVVTASNCLAHNNSILAMMYGAFYALRDGGEFWIEVKDGESLMNLGAWDDLYSEHPALWTVDSLKLVLGRIGFQYVQHEILPFHGGLIRMCVKKMGEDFEFSYPLPEDYFINLINKWSEIQKDYDSRYEDILVKKLLSDPANVAWGASGKASVLLSALNKVRFSYIVDDSPSKQGKYLPHTGIPIVGKHVLETEVEEKNVLVTAWNYFDNIVENNKHIENANWCRFF